MRISRRIYQPCTQVLVCERALYKHLMRCAATTLQFCAIFVTATGRSVTSCPQRSSSPTSSPAHSPALESRTLR